MARYRFPLAKILDYRKMLYDQAVWEFAPFAAKWGQLEQEQRKTEDAQNACFQSRVSTWQERVLQERYYASMRLKKREIEEEQEKLKPQYLREREKVLKAFRNLDFMEKLAKSSLDAYKRKIRKKEKNQLDDLTMMRYVGQGDS